MAPDKLTHQQFCDLANTLSLSQSPPTADQKETLEAHLREPHRAISGLIEVDCLELAKLMRLKDWIESTKS